MAVLIRQDVKTGKQYNEFNIPYGKLNSIETPSGKRFAIKAMNSGCPENSWHNGQLVDERWAVFELIKNRGFWQQVSPWYEKYGTASNRMVKLAQKG